MIVLETDMYNNIIKYIQNYDGLLIDCEKDIVQHFETVPRNTLCSIVSRENQNRCKQLHFSLNSKAENLLQQYVESAAKNQSNNIILEMAKKLKYSPIGLTRIILTIKYKEFSRSDITEMLRDPNLVPDSLLAANVGYCLYSDNHEGPLTDMIRRCIGEEYEIRLKKMAKDIGLVFYDENDLRRTGYDKTPDLKLAVPCMFRGKVIQWIESKASFGDMASHQKYVKDQLSSYVNRFGAGIVIYWFGYLDKIVDYHENGDNIIITETFPNKCEFELLKFDEDCFVADD